MLICKKCESEFPFHVVIDGVKRNLKGRSYCLSCSPFGQMNRRTLMNHEGTKKKCSRCHETKDRSDFHIKTVERTVAWCKVCNISATLTAKRRLKIRAIVYKGGSCLECGRMPHPASMHFHHREGETKLFKLSDARGWSQRFQDELDKCDLTCANCHAKHHAGNGWGELLAEAGLETH